MKLAPALILLAALSVGGCNAVKRTVGESSPDDQCASAQSFDLVYSALSRGLPKGEIYDRPVLREKVDIRSEFPLTNATVLSTDPKVGRTTCSAEVRLKRFGGMDAIPSNTKFRYDGGDALVTFTYVIGHRADTGQAFADIDRANELSMMFWAAHMMARGAFDGTPDAQPDSTPTPDANAAPANAQATTPEQYGDKESPAVAPDEGAASDANVTQ